MKDESKSQFLAQMSDSKTDFQRWPQHLRDNARIVTATFPPAPPTGTPRPAPGQPKAKKDD